MHTNSEAEATPAVGIEHPSTLHGWGWLIDTWERREAKSQWWGLSTLSTALRADVRKQQMLGTHSLGFRKRRLPGLGQDVILPLEDGDASESFQIC